MSVRPCTPALIRASNLLLDILDLADEAALEEKRSIGPGRGDWTNLGQVYDVMEKLLRAIGATEEMGELDVDVYLQTGNVASAG